MRWKNKLNGIKGRLDNAEEKLSEFEDPVLEIIQTKTKRKKDSFLNEQSIGEQWDNFKWPRYI